MPVYEIIPDGPWRSAIECTVKETATGKETKHIQIVRFFPNASTENYPIQWKKLPLLVLNEKIPDDPNDATPITDDAPNLNIFPVPEGIIPAEVPIQMNSGWPNGKLLITWK